MEICINTDKNIIENIIKDSIADELGLEVGDEILSINGENIKDIIDYKYLISDEYIELEIKKLNGELISFEIEKDFYEDLGIEFSNPLIDEAKRCSNNCVFCFIDQLPPNMRQTLYFKDDDSRLSFLQGNFITLTNMKEEDIERIIKYRISPINVSVHTTNPELRKKMLRNINASKIMDILKRFDEAHIEVNCQIVCIPDINDKEELDRTVRDLYELKNSVSSLAIVPVGITKYRENLPDLKPFDRQRSIEIIEQVHKLQREFLEKSNTRFVFLGDEFYILAGMNIPEDEEYEGYPQIENGVGLVRNFSEEINEELKNYQISNNEGEVTLVTGELAKEFMEDIKSRVLKKLPNYKINVRAIKNDFFGRTITVAGLVTGIDIIKQVDKMDYKNLMIPDCMLRANTDYFLDDTTLGELENKLNRKVFVTKVDGKDFLKKLFKEIV